MDKIGLVCLHACLEEARVWVEERHTTTISDSAFRAYDQLDIYPEKVTATADEHKDAIDALAADLLTVFEQADCAPETSSNAPNPSSHNSNLPQVKVKRRCEGDRPCSATRPT
jgi:hypothetical protein